MSDVWPMEVKIGTMKKVALKAGYPGHFLTLSAPMNCE